jgi:hypothetical protein
VRLWDSKHRVARPAAGTFTGFRAFDEPATHCVSAGSPVSISGPRSSTACRTGTQEQLAVLARLGFAEMLIDQGRPAMAILDDALVYSDDERIERMFDILTQASAKTQILILSCREGLLARLGGNRVELKQANSVAGK